MKKLIHIGVATIPINPDKLALKIAVGKFPFAKATMTTDEDTVDGKALKKNNAIHKFEAVPFSKSGRNDSTNRGKIIKVAV